MAPPKRMLSERSKASPALPPRVTRSQTAAAAYAPKTRLSKKSPGNAAPAAKSPPAKMLKAATPEASSQKSPGTGSANAVSPVEKAKKKSPEAAGNSSQKSPAASPPAEKAKKSKAAKTAVSEDVGFEDENDAAKASATAVIIIEACKQCQSFKRTAEKVKQGLEEGLNGVTVTINPDKPRRGCFEVRQENGETFVSLLDDLDLAEYLQACLRMDMPRPFKKMKELDLEKVVADVIDKII